LLHAFAVASLAALWFNNASAEDWSPLWSTATLSQARFSLAATSADGMVFFAGGYAAGGYTGNNYNGDTDPSNVVDIYNTSTGVWSTATLSQARGYLSATSVGNQIFFAGGNAGNYDTDPSNVVDIYNTSTGIWSTASLSQARASLSATSAGGDVLFGGGQTANGFSNVVDIYNTSAGTWSIATLSQARNNFAAASASGEIFFGGGYNGNSLSNLNVVDIYNMSTGIWSTGSLSQARNGLSATSAGGMVFFAGGAGVNEIDASSVVDIYDTSAGTWSTAVLSQARYYLSATTAGNQVLFAGGANNGNPSSVVDIYTLQNYPSISSTKTFSLVDQTTVAGLMQLNAPGSLALSTFNLNVGSMSGNAPIDLGNQTLTVGSDNTSTTYSGIISDVGTFVKIGSGTLVLAATNTYTGPTTISQGKLLVSGLLGNTAIIVNGGGALGGTGSIAGQVTLAGGSISAAQGTLDLVDGTIGTLTFSDTNAADNVLTIGGTATASPSILNFEVGSAADLLVLSSGKLVVNPGGGLINITPLDGFGPGTYDLIDFSASQASGLNNLLLNTPTIDGYSVYLQPTATAEELVVTPEPSTLALLGAGTISLIGWAWRRRQKRSMSVGGEIVSGDDQDEGPAILSIPSRWAEAIRRAA
jgi:autotransporter-associated beta strand protein